MAGAISAHRREPLINKTFAFALMERRLSASGDCDWMNHRTPKMAACGHMQLLVFQQLLPLP
jgi:hypothetical protein